MRAPEDSYPLEPVPDAELDDIIGRFYLKREEFAAAFELSKLAVALGVNDRCPCGSGRKVKKCHGGLHAEKIETRFRRSEAALRTSPYDWLSAVDPQNYPPSWQLSHSATRGLLAMSAMAAWSMGGGRARW